MLAQLAARLIPAERLRRSAAAPALAAARAQAARVPAARPVLTV